MNNRKRIAYCFYGFCGSTTHINYITNNKMEELMISINYNHFKKYVLDCNKDIDIDIFVLSYNTTSKEKILELYKPVKSKFMTPKIDFDFFDDKKYNNIEDEQKYLYNKSLISRLHGLFKFGQMLKKYTENNNLIYDNVVLSRFDLAFQKELKLDIHINDNFKLVKSFNSIYPTATSNNYPPYSDQNLNFVNQGLSNPNKNTLLLGYDHTFKVNEILFMGNMNDIYKITLLYPLLCELNKEELFNATSNYGKFRFSINPHYLFSYIILGIITSRNIKINYFKDLYYDIPPMTDEDSIKYGELWANTVTIPITRLCYLKSYNNIGDIKVNMSPIREFFNIEDFKDCGLSEEELKLII